MSDEDSRDSKESKANVLGDNVCRDFLRNVCRRGAQCKYKHPEAQSNDSGSKKMEYNFCHDFQNRECHRPNCKFLHCTRQEEQEFHTTGELPKHVTNGIHKSLPGEGGGVLPGRGEAPICKDYQKGDCRRGARCKFRHVNSPEYDMDDIDGPSSRNRRDRFDRYDRYNPYDNFEPEPKRRAFDDPYGRPPHLMSGNGGGAGGGNLMAHTLPPYSPEFRMLEEENILMRRKLEEMKKQLTELSATNEFLLNQNAQLRLSKQQSAMASVGPSLSSMSAGNPMASMMNSNMASERMADIAGPMGVPVTLGQGMATVSMAPGSMGGMASVSMAQSMMTMSSPSTNLVSYPIMTQGMRPAIPHSMGH